MRKGSKTISLTLEQMLRINTSLVGIETAIKQLDSCLDNPPHIFIVGFPGTGKSTIAKDFIKAYFKKSGITKKEEAEYCMEISSHQDRGIHTFRQILNDHVRWIVPKKGVYRWIIIDDCDTLPAISQQALRRPMETYNHITRFIFISQNQESLIAPLQSRCHIILLEPSNNKEIFTEILRREGFPEGSYTEEAYTELVLLSVSSIMKFQSMAKMLYSLKKLNGWEILSIEQIKSSFDPHIWNSMKDLLYLLMNSQWEQAQQQMYKIWELGYSFEDILFELEHNIIIMSIVDHRAWYNIQQFLIKSWIYHSQSRSSILDLMTVCNEIKPWKLNNSIKQNE